jgi:glutathione S-transferase
MPKPELTALTGGYRKIPVLQIGNHVYCDTALIARVLENVAPEPTLFPTASAESLAEWADSAFFESVVPMIMRPSRVDELLKWMTPHELNSMRDDRRLMREGARRVGVSPKIARSYLNVYLARFDATLAQQPFLLGEQPSIADFSVYHSAWMLENVAPEPLASYANLRTWMRRIADIPQPAVTPISGEDAVRVCRDSDPAWQPAQAFADPLGFTQGQLVVVRAGDYGRDAVQGQLVASTANELTLKREDEQAGTVYVHFPRIGFEVEAAPEASAT